ncbi:MULTISPECIES: hypothetical protein [unclassified Streptomyces]|uniref:hypothetical protein n=1 Tax=unclassified Streptomyces TaxID=2593676 RepID=UPI00211D920A|nr:MULTISPECIES: hypothetical protein [unclassified Streptomyces]
MDSGRRFRRAYGERRIGRNRPERQATRTRNNATALVPRSEARSRKGRAGFPPPGRIREAAALLARAGRTQGAGDVAALGDLLTVAAAVSPATVRAHVRAAAAAFEQASRAPGARTLDGTARTRFKAATRALERAPRTARGGGAPAVLNLLLALVEAIEAATAWHRAQHHRAQTTAAAQAAALLREAADLTTTGTPARTTASRTTSRTVRVTPAPERGPVPLPPVTGVPPRPPTGTPPGPGPGPGRSR